MKKFLLTCLLVGITTVLVQSSKGRLGGYVYLNNQAWDATLILNENNNTAILYRSDRTVYRMTAAEALQGQQLVMDDMTTKKKWAALIGWIIDSESALKLDYNPFE